MIEEKRGGEGREGERKVPMRLAGWQFSSVPWGLHIANSTIACFITRFITRDVSYKKKLNLLSSFLEQRTLCYRGFTPIMVFSLTS